MPAVTRVLPTWERPRPQASGFLLAPVQLPCVSELRDRCSLPGERRPADPALGRATAGRGLERRGGGRVRPALPGPRPARPPARPPAWPAPPYLVPGPGPGRRPAGWGHAMSHGSGLVRTTCSSGGALGPGVGASQPSEGLLDSVYPRTQGALLKVAQMVREGGRGAGVTPIARGGLGRGAHAPTAGPGRSPQPRAAGRVGAAPPKPSPQESCRRSPRPARPPAVPAVPPPAQSRSRGPGAPQPPLRA